MIKTYHDAKTMQEDSQILNEGGWTEKGVVVEKYRADEWRSDPACRYSEAVFREHLVFVVTYEKK